MSVVSALGTQSLPQWILFLIFPLTSCSSESSSNKKTHKLEKPMDSEREREQESDTDRQTDWDGGGEKHIDYMYGVSDKANSTVLLTTKIHTCALVELWGLFIHFSLINKIKTMKELIFSVL